MEKRTQIGQDTKEYFFNRIVEDYSIWNEFTTEEEFEDYLVAIRWSGKPICTRCGGERFYKLKEVRKNKNYFRFKCANNQCYHMFAAANGTIFQNKKIPFRVAFNIIYEVVGIGNDNSFSLAEKYNITQNTSWSWVSLIRGGNLSTDGVSANLARRNLKKKFPEEHISKELVEIEQLRLELNRELNGGKYKGGLTWNEYYKIHKKRILAYGRKSFQKRRQKIKN